MNPVLESGTRSLTSRVGPTEGGVNSLASTGNSKTKNTTIININEHVMNFMMVPSLLTIFFTSQNPFFGTGFYNPLI
jgi:hypothetical protein